MPRPSAASSRCVQDRCGNITRHPTRRCHLHRDGVTLPKNRSVPTVPTPSSSPEPTVVYGRTDGGRTEYWHAPGGCPHRPGGPTSVTYRSDGTVMFETFSVKDEYHRLDGPASIDYFRSGRPQSENYYRHGKRHRTDGPAEITYRDLAGRLAAEVYYIDGKKHRLDGPAEISYSPKGEVRSEEWYRKGERHRIDGPAIVFYEDGLPTRGTIPWRIHEKSIGNHSFDNPRDFAAKLRLLPEKTLRREFTSSSFRTYLDEGVPISRLIDVVEADLTSPEAVRAMLDGAPVEWARAFDEGLAPRS